MFNSGFFNFLDCSPHREHILHCDLVYISMCMYTYILLKTVSQNSTNFSCNALYFFILFPSVSFQPIHSIQFLKNADHNSQNLFSNSSVSCDPQLKRHWFNPFLEHFQTQTIYHFPRKPALSLENLEFLLQLKLLSLVDLAQYPSSFSF